MTLHNKFGTGNRRDRRDGVRARQEPGQISPGKTWLAFQCFMPYSHVIDKKNLENSCQLYTACPSNELSTEARALEATVQQFLIYDRLIHKFQLSLLIFMVEK